jgi:hypothetical protein
VEELEQVWVCCGWRTPNHSNHPKHVEQFPDKINCVTVHLVGYITEYYSDARTHIITMHGHILLRCTDTYYYDARTHKR